MSTVPAHHVSWTQIWVFVGVIFAPSLTGFVILVRGGQQFIDKLEVVNTKVTDQGADIKQIKQDIRQLSTRQDTMAHRQDMDRLQNTFHYQAQSVHKQHSDWFIEVKDENGKIHKVPVNN